MNRQELIAKLVAQGVAEAEAPALADSILGEHSKIASDLRSKVAEGESKIKSLEASEKALNEQLDANKAMSEELGTAQSTIEDLNKQLTTVQEQVSQGDMRFGVLNEVIKTNPHDPQDVMKFVDMSKVTKGEDGTLEGLEDQIKGLQESKAYLFQGELTQQGYTPATSKGQVPPVDKPDPSKMTFEERINQAVTSQMEGRTQTNQSNPMNVQD